MMTRICRKRGLILRSNLAPVITRLPLAWRSLPYRLARVSGNAVADPGLRSGAAALPVPVVPATAHGNGGGTGIDPDRGMDPTPVPDLEAESAR